MFTKPYKCAGEAGAPPPPTPIYAQSHTFLRISSVKERFGRGVWN